MIATINQSCKYNVVKINKIRIDDEHHIEQYISRHLYKVSKYQFVSKLTKEHACNDQACVKRGLNLETHHIETINFWNLFCKGKILLMRNYIYLT